MTAFDKQIATDLASLGTEHRRGVIALDDVLQALDARRTRRTEQMRGELAMVRLAQAFALRAAAAVTGGAALVIAFGMWLLLYRPSMPCLRGMRFWDDWSTALMQVNTLALALSTGLALIAIYATTGPLARRWFVRRASGEPLEATMRRVDRASIALFVAGVPSIVVLVGTVAATVGHNSWGSFLCAGSDWFAHDIVPAMVHRLRAVAIAMSGFTVTGFAIGAVWPRRWPELPRVETDADLLATSKIFGDRVARGVGGAVAGFAAILAVIAFHRKVPSVSPRSFGVAIDHALFWWTRDRLRCATLSLIAILVAQQIARAWAARRFAHQLRAVDAGELPGRARRLARSVDGWSIGLGAGGAAALGAMFSVASIAAGDQFWAFYDLHGPRLAQVVRLAEHIMTPAVPLVFVLGAGIGRLATCERRPRLIRILSSCRMFELATALTLFTVVLGAALDFGVQDVSVPSRVAPVQLQTIVSLASVASILTFALSYALRRRRREQAHLE